MTVEPAIDDELVLRGKELRNAELILLEAENRYRDASRDRTIALNVLNNQQKLFDEYVAKLKAASPAGSDWKRDAGHGAVQCVES